MYSAIITMIEKDWGSLSGTYQKLYDKLTEWVKDALRKAGVAVGEVLGLGPAAALVGEIFARIGGWFFGWLARVFGNDNMGSFTTKATVNSYAGNWVGGGSNMYRSAQRLAAHGGVYRVEFTWQLA